MSFRIFLHSVRLVLSQLVSALKISGALYALSLLVTVIAAMSQARLTLAGEVPIGWQTVVGAVVTCALYIWTAVGWHRFVLLDEEPGLVLPNFHGHRLLAYLGRTLQIALIGMLVAGFFGFVAVLLAFLLGPVASLLVALVATIAMLLVSFRLAPLLPGAAIGQKVDLRDAWESTQLANGTLVGLALIAGVAVAAVDMVSAAVTALPGPMVWVGMAMFAITGWFKLMVWVSIITTIYGVYVEGRRLR